MINEQEDQKSQFNLGMAYLYQTQNLMLKITEASLKQDFSRMMLLERALFRQIASRLKKEEREQFHNNFKGVSKLLKERSQISEQSLGFSPLEEAENFHKKKSILALNRSKILRELEVIDVWLRDKLEARGMLIPTKKDSTFMGGGD